MLRLSATFGLVLASLGHASKFLSRSISIESVDKMLESELPSSRSQSRFLSIKAELEPMYIALPKNELGRLESATVRYALHRHFAHRYGWYVRGLTGDRNTFKSNSSAEILKDRVPQHILSTLEKKVSGRGLDLDDLATFAATLVDLIEMDALAGFEECVDALSLPRTGSIDEDKVADALRGYLARFIFGTEQEVHDDHILHIIEEEVKGMYSGWPSTVMWLEDTHKTIEWLAESRRNPFTPQEQNFKRAAGALQQVMQRFAEVANSECPEIKNRLVAMEHEGSGRVRLIDFYAAAPAAGIKAESKAYLANLGVLDETDPARPMLLIANYVSSNTNCLVDSSYYSSCCLSECEQLFGKLEQTIATSLAKPSAIVNVISNLPSDTVDAPRNLSTTMIARLSEIALKHDGKVPLHGRLFTQWMHHAYPRECPYPQLANGETPLSQEEFFELHGLEDVFVNNDELAEHIDPKNFAVWEKPSHISAEDLPWNDFEELVASNRFTAASSTTNTMLRIIMACIAFGSMAVGLTRSLTRGATAAAVTKQVTCV